MINIGSLDVDKIYVGNDEVDKIYVGNDLVWSSQIPTITFYVANVPYTANQNQTWESWISSPYNIYNFAINSIGDLPNKVDRVGYNYVLYRYASDGYFVDKSDIILEGNKYIYSTEPH